MDLYWDGYSGGMYNGSKNNKCSCDIWYVIITIMGYREENN